MLDTLCQLSLIKHCKCDDEWINKRQKTIACMKIIRRTFLAYSLKSAGVCFLLSAVNSPFIFPVQSLAQDRCKQCGFGRKSFDIRSPYSRFGTLENCPNCGAENFLRHSDMSNTCSCIASQSKMGTRSCCAVPFASQAAGANSAKPFLDLTHLQFWYRGTNFSCVAWCYAMQVESCFARPPAIWRRGIGKSPRYQIFSW